MKPLINIGLFISEFFGWKLPENLTFGRIASRGKCRDQNGLAKGRRKMTVALSALTLWAVGSCRRHSRLRKTTLPSYKVSVDNASNQSMNPSKNESTNESINQYGHIQRLSNASTQWPYSMAYSINRVHRWKAFSQECAAWIGKAPQCFYSAPLSLPWYVYRI